MCPSPPGGARTHPFPNSPLRPPRGAGRPERAYSFSRWIGSGYRFAIRVGDWKAHFFEQRGEGIGVWREAFSELRFPKLFNLRADPFESDTSLLYDKWNADRMFMLVPAQVIVAKWLESFKQFPIRQRPASFNLDSVMQSLMPHS